MKAQFAYAFRLAYNNKVPAIQEQVAYYYKLAADQGHGLAQASYATLLKKGIGNNSPESIVHYYKLAADKGFAMAQYDYANCLANGDGVPADGRLAARYYKLAANQRHVKARRAIAASIELAAKQASEVNNAQGRNRYSRT